MQITVRLCRHAHTSCSVSETAQPVYASTMLKVIVPLTVIGCGQIPAAILFSMIYFPGKLIGTLSCDWELPQVMLTFTLYNWLNHCCFRSQLQNEQMWTNILISLSRNTTFKEQFAMLRYQDSKGLQGPWVSDFCDALVCQLWLWMLMIYTCKPSVAAWVWVWPFASVYLFMLCLCDSHSYSYDWYVRVWQRTSHSYSTAPIFSWYSPTTGLLWGEIIVWCFGHCQDQVRQQECFHKADICCALLPFSAVT